MLALTLCVMLSVCLHCWVFDLIEHRRCSRRADLRLVILRLWHATLLEVMLVMTSVPIIVCWAGLSWPAALLIDIGIAVTYMLFNLGVFRVYDWLRPLRAIDLAIEKSS